MEQPESMATVTSMQRERVGNSASLPSVRVVRGADGRARGRVTLDDAVIAICFLALVAVVVLGGLLMLFSWVTAALPTSPTVACYGFNACPVSAPDEDQVVWPVEPGIQEPIQTP
jgi:hypothetical protein